MTYCQLAQLDLFKVLKNQIFYFLKTFFVVFTMIIFFQLKAQFAKQIFKKRYFYFFLHKCFYESFQRKEIEDNHGIVEGHGREPILH